MPEGDVVFRACATLHAALAGRTLTRAELRVPRHATAALVGRTVLEVVPRGKHQLIRLEDGLSLHTHLRMDGSWKVVATGARWPRPAYQIRVVLENAEHTAIGLRLPVVELLRTRDEDRAVGHLGPDLLADEFDLAEACRRLRAEPGRTIGEALLDQRNLAGIGTFYRAEVLFLQGIHPRTPVERVERLDRVCSQARQLMRANLSGPYQVSTGDPRPGMRSWVFDRAGRACRRCGTRIAVEEFGPVAQERRSFWCPHCQPER